MLGLTVGVPGLVEADGFVELAPNLRWRQVDLRKSLYSALNEPNYPLLVENDANLAVLAEQRYGGQGATAVLDGPRQLRYAFCQLPHHIRHKGSTRRRSASTHQEHRPSPQGM